jgi:hypothetical protein
LELRGQFGTDPSALKDARHHPRFTLEVEVLVFPRQRPPSRGHTVDISQSGLAVMLIDELSTGELVRVEFTVSHGKVDTHAMVRQRNAFRYGLQFVESATATDIIGQTCRQLALEQTLFVPRPILKPL